jgi:hypothetical protein
MLALSTLVAMGEGNSDAIDALRRLLASPSSVLRALWDCTSSSPYEGLRDQSWNSGFAQSGQYVVGSGGSSSVK